MAPSVPLGSSRLAPALARLTFPRLRSQPPYVIESPSLEFAIAEHQPATTPVCFAETPSNCNFAAELQDGETLAFSLVASTPNHAGRFVVDPSTAAFSLGAELDYEDVQQYKLLVKADDEGTRSPGVDHPLQDTAEVTVHVIDLNDRPYPTRPLTRMTVPENAAAGTEVGCVEVHDDDVNRTGSIAPWQNLSFELIDASPVFFMDAASGCVRVQAGALVDYGDSTFGAMYVCGGGGRRAGWIPARRLTRSAGPGYCTATTTPPRLWKALYTRCGSWPQTTILPLR